MTLKEYKKSYYSNLSFESDNNHRYRTKEIYQFEYPNAEFIEKTGNEDGTGMKIWRGELEYDNFIDLINEYMNNDKVKFMTMSKEFSVNKWRDEAVQKAIEKGKIFLNAYGNDNTKVFKDGDKNLWISVLGVNQHTFSKKWIVNGYVNDDLSKIDKRYTFAVARREDGIPSLGWSGTSFDQPYFTQILNKICT